MKRAVLIIFGALVLSGCTTYSINKGKSPYDQGYVVARRGFVILEYTIGENNTVADTIDLAKERFKRRKKTVEYYYEKLGDIQSNYQCYFLKPLKVTAGLVTSPFRLPVVAYQDHKYQHNPAYKEKIDKIDDERDRIRHEKMKLIKDYLDKYIQDDLVYEKELMAVKAKPKGPVLAEATKSEETVQVPQQPVEEKVEVLEEKPIATQAVVEEKPEEEKVEKPVEKEAVSEVVIEEKPVEEKSIEEKPIEVQVIESEKTTEVSQPEEVVASGEDKEKKIAEELAVQQAKETEEKPAKVSMWQKMKNAFKPKEKTAKVQEEVSTEEKPKKESLWSKMKNAFKGKEKPAVATERIPTEAPVAIIVAKPLKGYSPLKVHFSASRCRAIKARIVSYEWDFGDGDKSKKPNPINTFYSGSFEPKKFTVTLTIQDDKGNIGTTATDIEVLNK